MEVKVHFHLGKKSWPRVLMPAPRIGDKIVLEGEKAYYEVTDVQWQLRDEVLQPGYSVTSRVLILVNVFLKEVQ